MEPEPQQRTVEERALPAAMPARVLLAIGGMLYPAWWFVASLLHPEGLDSFGERLGVASVWWLLLVASFHRKVAPHVDRLGYFTLYILTAHYFSIVWRSGGAALFVLGTPIVLASATVTCHTVRRVVAYSAFVLAAAAAVEWGIAEHDATSTLFLPGAATVQLMLAAGTWRGIVVRDALTREMEGARRFLGLVLDAVPDPVFVENDRGRFALVNSAFARLRGQPRDALVGQPATGTGGLSASLREDASDGRWAEGEQVIEGAAGPRIFATKVAFGHTTRSERVLVGVMRDITERKELAQSLAAKIEELQRARTRVRQLEGLLPVCMHCRRIRTDEGQWQDIEAYVQAHSAAVFTHGLCRGCLETHHPE